jgi:hypothetical protein
MFFFSFGVCIVLRIRESSHGKVFFFLWEGTFSHVPLSHEILPQKKKMTVLFLIYMHTNVLKNHRNT